MADAPLEPGSDEAYRKQLDPELVYRFQDSNLKRNSLG